MERGSERGRAVAGCEVTVRFNGSRGWPAGVGRRRSAALLASAAGALLVLAAVVVLLLTGPGL
ncbi:hypothetical protein ACFU9B_04710 [Streptomyces sp. NPDC057592]|uniref:hypothetical protein n=1 Tax=unclassified Streptomyces TaxID=2593676 RepID=UPI0033170649